MLFLRITDSGSQLFHSQIGQLDAANKGLLEQNRYLTEQCRKNEVGKQSIQAGKYTNKERTTCKYGNIECPKEENRNFRHLRITCRSYKTDKSEQKRQGEVTTQKNEHANRARVHYDNSNMRCRELKEKKTPQKEKQKPGKMEQNKQTSMEQLIKAVKEGFKSQEEFYLANNPKGADQIQINHMQGQTAPQKLHKTH